MLSEAYGGGAMRRCLWMAETVGIELRVEITNEDNAQHLFDINDIVNFKFIPQGQTVS
jgi:hypothetical protein